MPVEGGDVPVLVIDHMSESPDQAPVAGYSVLVVEDNPDAAELAQIVLQDAGAQVRVASDYESALASLAQEWPHVL